ncbi:MAG: mucoidy inhibitor MuiA family protein, partial [Hyphomicrobiaceae bacterium]|nr:mucoidy inhibitor MuiA family protein [Hyphomicrobiaceae bacterium]
GSIRVDGKATAKLDIRSVDARRLYIPRADQSLLHAERKRLEDEIEKLRDERGLAQGQQDAAQTQKTLLGNLAQMPGRPLEGKESTQPVPQTDWAQVLALIGTGMTQAQRSALEAEVTKRELDRKIEELEKKLSEVVPARVQQTEVKVFVNAAAPLDAELTVRYQVRNASWRPRYDARLDTGSKTAASRLDLTRRAEIRQSTGESWDNITLRLSTTRPTAQAAAPELHTATVDFEPELKPGLAAAPPDRMTRALGKVAREEAEADALRPMVMPNVVAANAAVAAAPFQAVFAVPGRLTIPATGEAKRVQLQENNIEPTLTVRTVPKVDPKAYLYVKFILPKGAPLLPGAVSLFRDGAFVGTGKLPVLAPGEEHELGFGADDQVRVRHAIVGQTRGETGLISSLRTDSRKFRITVKNQHERAVELVVLDQVPISLNEEIKVTLLGPTKPTTHNVDDKRGVIAFESKLEPEQERVIEFGYRVTWPGKRPIIYGR